MRVRSVFLCAAVATGVAGTAFAQAPATFSLRDALLEARRANPQLIALQRQAESVRAAVPASRFLDPPMVESQIWGWPVTTLNPARTDMYMFMGEQTLPGKGKRAARERVATDDARLAEAQIPIRANAIYAEVKEAYAELFLARSTADLFVHQTPLLRATTDVASIRYTAGQSGQHDTVKSVVELSRLGVEAIEWRERARIAETRINVLMGRAPDTPVSPLAPTEPAEIDAAEGERIALAGSPDLAMARTTIEREEAELARIRGESRPDYVVGGGYMLQPGMAGAWTARAGITWPNAPWSRGRITTEITAQEKRLEAVRAQRDALALAIRQDIREAAVRLDAARERVRLLETTVLPNITQAVDVATVAYGSNRGEYADLLDSQRLLLTTRMELIAARANVQRAAADLESAIGLGLEN
jgi:outer membrane protein, heavy metal efflux system